MLRFLLSLVLVFSLIIIGRSAISEEVVEPRGPEQISEKEWHVINNYINDHQICLKDEMVNSLEIADNARDVSNHILEICSPHLLELKQQMLAWTITPVFIDRYLYSKKNKAANKMLKAIMVLMANKRSVSDKGDIDSK